MIVIVPYRPDYGHRDRIWRFLHDHYWSVQGYPVVIGHHDTDGPFNRAKAINAAANRPWDMAVIADSDTWVPTAQLRKAVLTAKITGRLVAAFDTVVEINQWCTSDIVTGRLPLSESFACERVRRRDLETQSSMLVIPRPLWDRIGGYDDAFQGWGGEDNAFWRAADITGGPPHRIPGNAYHLWHPPADSKHSGPYYAANRELWHQYQSARTVEDLKRLRSASSPTPPA